MKTKIIILGLFLLSSALYAQTFTKAIQVGGISEEQSNGIVLDSDGNMYITGWFWGTSSTFGATTLSSLGQDDVFIAKLDSSGNVLWATQGGGTTGDYSYDIALDAAGNVYITGLFTGTATYGSTVLTSAGGTDIFIAKLSSTGAFLWAKRAGGNGSGDVGNAIAVDAAGNSYIIGDFAATSDFGSISLTSNGFEDVFFAKYDTNGNVIWANQGGSSDYDYGSDIIVNGSELYLTGSFAGTATFGSNTLTTSGFSDLFIIGADTSGTINLAVQSGSQSGSYTGANGIARDASGNIYVTGDIEGNVTFGATTLTSIGFTDLLVAKYKPGTGWEWTKQAGGDEAIISGERIALDASGNSYVTGWIRDTVYFGSNMVKSYPFGDYNVFIAKYSNSGTFEWVKSEGGTSPDIHGRDIAVDANNNVYVTGAAADTVTLDGLTFVSADYDAYIVRVSQTTSPLTIPAAPTNLAITAVRTNNGKLQLTWQDNANNEDGFVIERSLDSTAWVLADSVVANATGYLDTLLMDSTQYFYRVYAYNAAGNSSFSNTAGGTTFASSIKESSGKSNYVIYPNPNSTGILSISGTEKIKEISIYNLTGQLISSYKAENGLTSIAIETLSKGVYFIKVQTYSEETLEKLIVN